MVLEKERRRGCWIIIRRSALWPEYSKGPLSWPLLITFIVPKVARNILCPSTISFIFRQVVSWAEQSPLFASREDFLCRSIRSDYQTIISANYRKFRFWHFDLVLKCTFRQLGMSERVLAKKNNIILLLRPTTDVCSWSRMYHRCSKAQF